MDAMAMAEKGPSVVVGEGEGKETNGDERGGREGGRTWSRRGREGERGRRQTGPGCPSVCCYVSCWTVAPRRPCRRNLPWIVYCCCGGVIGTCVVFRSDLQCV